MYNNIVKKWEDDRFSLLLQDIEGFLFAHCYVYDESLSTIKHIRKVSKEVVEWAYSDGYDGVHTFTENKKFAELIPNARFLEDIQDNNKVYGVYKWELQSK